MFVRQDLLMRHKKRHSTSYVPRNRASSFSLTAKDSSEDGNSIASPGSTHNGQPILAPLAPAPAPALAPTLPPSLPPSLSSPLRPLSVSQQMPPQPPTLFSRQPASAPRNASVLLSPNSTLGSQPAPTGSMGHAPPWPRAMEGVTMLPPKPTYYPQGQAALHDHSSFMPFPDLQVSHDAGDMSTSFGIWLFDNQQAYGDFNVTNLSFLDGGLESPFNNNIHYDHESLTSRSQVDQTPPRHHDMPDELISESRRLEIVKCIHMFHRKQDEQDPRLDYLLQESGNDFPAINSDFLHECIRHYWDIVSPRLPIVHQPTFSPAACPIHLLLVMIALGAAQIHGQSPTGEHEDYKALANLIITSIRLEILGDKGAVPPVDLRVAQALLLVEFYEKMYTTRKLHERGHIYHCVTLNFLRRGSPLIGKAGLESPPDEQSGVDPGTDDRAWARWAETEAMHRVVFGAFMMDILHAAMFGHVADMAPHEIRLPLPCDEVLWTATSHENARHQEANLRMYGVRPVFFLDGLKRALHGKEVRTHAFGRMVIMYGLLSVGWHLRHRETHLKWLDITPHASETRDKWCKMLLKALDDWKTSFDDAIGLTGLNTTDPSTGGQQSPANGLIQSAAVLYHLAHISLYVDIIDCQVYAGAKRLLGRKVSSRDLTNVNTRMAVWAGQLLTRRAILHAFKLLHRILIDPRQKKIAPIQDFGGHNMGAIQYSTRADSDPHRPWIMYFATLSIWSFAQAFKGQGQSTRPFFPSGIRRGLNTVPEYLSRIAKLSELDLATSATLCDGLHELLDEVYALLSQSHWELLQEACARLVSCKELMHSGGAT
ncbi:putative zinc c2h2 type domain-containing protein [Rosellinia necatrix]|uniref:Putative zinc c2h2 type domain-containing protein n=1 Tax=Rosellinia necatrix TaxID=77044 RepID=A0A1W2TR36_ROSNE|nr:putative zinc c2h2 type domain-containing protein [Rosellinia necatrix]